MNIEERIKLQKLNNKLVQDVRVIEVLPQLMQDGILNQDDFYEINSEKAERNKTQILLNILTNRGKNAFDCFSTALEPSYSYLVKDLKNIQVTKEDLDILAKRNKGNQIINRDVIKLVKKDIHIIRHWKTLANALGLTARCHQLQVQAGTYMWDIEECINLLLDEWVKVKGKAATLPRLIAILRTEEFNLIADDLEEQFISF